MHSAGDFFLPMSNIKITVQGAPSFVCWIKTFLNCVFSEKLSLATLRYMYNGFKVDSASRQLYILTDFEASKYCRLCVWVCSVLSTLAMVLGKLMFGFVLGNIASTLANMEMQRVMYDMKLQSIKVCGHVYLPALAPCGLLSHCFCIHSAKDVLLFQLKYLEHMWS